MQFFDIIGIDSTDKLLSNTSIYDNNDVNIDGDDCITTQDYLINLELLFCM